MKRLLLCSVIAGVAGAFADEPSWPADFWEQVEASRQTLAANARISATSQDALPTFDTWATVRVRSNGIDFSATKRDSLTIVIR